MLDVKSQNPNPRLKSTPTQIKILTTPAGVVGGVLRILFAAIRPEQRVRIVC